MAILHIKNHDFQKEVFESQKPVILDFLQPGVVHAKCLERFWNS